VDFSSIGWSPYLPARPYSEALANRLVDWYEAAKFPHQPVILDAFKESVNTTALNTLYGKTADVQNLIATWCKHNKDSEKERDAAIETSLLALCNTIGVRGILTLLGIICTLGSIDRFPPSRARLVRAFNIPHNGTEILSTGARALTKHFHRSLIRWWGDFSKGSDVEKNARANRVLRTLLTGAVWINVHSLPPHHLPVLEIRTHEGYGARWTADGKFFRGFLEPHTADGHEKGWKH